MRILLTFVTVGRGGDAIQLLALAEALRARHHEVTLVGAHRVTPYAFDTRSARFRGMMHRLPWWARDFLELGLSVVASWRALRAGRAQPVDLIIHCPGAYDFEAGYLARFLRVPLIVYLDAHLESERVFRGEGYWRRLHIWAMRTLGQAAGAIAVSSRPIADYCAGLGVPPGKLVVCRNGVSERHWRLGMEMAQARPPFPGTRPCTLGFVGSLTAWHRVDLLLDAVRRLNHPERLDVDRSQTGERSYRLVIVGRGTEYDALKARAQSLGLEAEVEWRGAMCHDDAVRATADFDIAVLPGTLSTGTPMKLVEYAAMARPIIAPDLSNIRDMFTAGTEIILVRPGDAGALAQAISALAGDPAQARRLGRGGQARAARYTWEAAVDLLLSPIARIESVSASVPALAAAGKRVGRDPDATP